MALSTYLNSWDFLQTPINYSETCTMFHEEEEEEATPKVLELASDHNNRLGYNNSSDESFFHFPNTFFDQNSYFDPTTTTLFYPEEIYLHDLLSSTSSANYDEPFISLSDIFPTEDNSNSYTLQQLPCPKRQKCCYDNKQLEHSSLLDNLAVGVAPPPITTNFFDIGFVPNNIPCDSLPAEELVLPTVPEELLIFPAMPALENLQQVELPQGDFEKKISKEKTTASAQSVVARERRRKISEKTQELGTLVPGGCKMNTAEMLHAAAKYVQYLQAQVKMLQFINTLQEDKVSPPISEDLQALLVSPCVQEKLYSEEMCFVPEEFVTTLTNHDDVQSRPSILKDLKKLIGSDIEKKAKQE